MNAHRIIPVVFLLAFSLFVPSEISAQQTETETEKKFNIPETDEGLPGAGPIRRLSLIHI